MRDETREQVDERLRADAWHPDAGMDRLERLVTAGDLQPSPQQRMSLHHYRTGREAAQRQGHDTELPPEAA